MEFTFKGKIALVTGAGKGIGRGIAKALWQGGATVYALSRTQSDLDSLMAECPGTRCLLVDLQYWTETKQAVEQIGHVDLLVNNAGVWLQTSVLETTEDDYTTMMNVFVKAAVNTTQVVAKGMVKRGTGSIVNISGIDSIKHFGGGYVIGAAKAALDQLTRCQAVELGPHGIRVNAVNPSVTKTSMVAAFLDAKESNSVHELVRRSPMGRAAEIQDVVNATLYLLSDKAEMINGAILPVDGGFWCT